MDALPVLSPAEVRVLGSLVEKQITTPDYYPLSLNALVNACNQLTNREPVVSFDDQTVLKAIDGLRDKRLATLFHGAESRVAKYRHALGDVILLTPAETAIVCVLLLRGPQTLGELRSRSERLFAFDNLGEVEAALNGLLTRDPPLVTRLPRAPGTKESRYAHLLSGPVDAPAAESAGAADSATSSAPSPNPAPDAVTVTRLEQELADVRRELAELKHQFADFRKQFE
ncbi:MAG TPA: YceH family protein [Opitutaceae bacterium]|nr:YceH family protein [Opitutaceae bacterium]